MHKYHPSKGIIHVGCVSFLIKIILSLCLLASRLPWSIIKKKSTIVKSVEQISFKTWQRGRDPLLRFFSLLPWKLSFIRSVEGVEDREEPRPQPRDNHVTKETTSVSCQTASPGKPRFSPEDRSKVRRPQETREWFLRLRCNIGFCAPPRCPQIKENSVSRKFCVLVFFFFFTSFVI